MDLLLVDASAAGRVEAAVQALASAAAGSRVSRAAEIPAGPPSAAGVAQLAADAGYALSRRESGALVVDLEVPEAHFTARVGSGEGGCVQVFAEIAELRVIESLPLACREAVGSFLLSLSAHVRGVRPVLVPSASGGGAIVGFEAATPTSDAVHLQRCLEACSVACSLSAEEVRALCDGSVADRYLACRRLD
jgi:hypothetical protein